jgi:hypothetical protein
MKEASDYFEDPLYQQGDVTVTKTELKVGKKTYDIEDLRGFKKVTVCKDGSTRLQDSSYVRYWRGRATNFILFGLFLMFGAIAMIIVDAAIDTTAKLLLVLSLILIGWGYIILRSTPIRYAIQISSRFREPWTGGATGIRHRSIVVSEDSQEIEEIGSAIFLAQYLADEASSSNEKS